jgi:hypothetical protein
MLNLHGKWVLLAIALATMALTFWIRESAPSYQKCQANYQAERESEKQEENAASLFVVRGLAYRCTNRLIESHKDAIIAVATVLLTIVTGFLVWVGYRQVTTTRAQLRAYVVAYGKDIEVMPGRLISHVEVINTGQTPARNLKILSQTCVLLHPPPVGFDFSLIDPGEPSAAVLGAGRTFNAASAIEENEMPIEEWDEASSKNGWLRVYTYGTVTYDDVFNRPQWTQFCFYMQWDTHTHVAGTVSQYHNDAS